MTSEQLSEAILNWQSGKTAKPLSELLDLFHDAVVEECAALCERLVHTDPPRLLAFARAAREIRALKGCS